MAKDPLTGETVPWHDDRRNWIDGSVDGDLPMTRLSEMFNVNHFIVSQVNPHVVPFLAKEEGPGVASSWQPWLSSQWLNTMTNLAREEALHRINVLYEMGIFQNVSKKTASILDQKYSGDINIFPQIPYSHFPRILQNPTSEFILETCLSGERATWPKISRIRNHLAIELALDSAVRTMRARVALSPPVAAPLGAANQTSSQSQAGSDEHRQVPAQRRSSYSHESGSKTRGGGRNASKTRASVDLGSKARSSLSVGCIEPSRPLSPVARHQKQPHRRSATPTERRGYNSRSANPGNNKLFTVGADSDDESSLFTGAQHWQINNHNYNTASSIRPSSPQSRRTSPAASRRSSVARMASIPLSPSQPVVKKSHSLGG
jgi:TAG lipase/steryl ester hydrolase/phospholipase A2/LPA acyltransferase